MAAESAREKSPAHSANLPPIRGSADDPKKPQENVRTASTGQIFDGPPIYTTKVEDSNQNIRDYLPWSILNLIFGVFLLGILGLIYSLQVRSHRKQGLFSEARQASRNALIANAVCTIVAVGVWAFIIYQIVVVVQASNSATYSRSGSF